MRDADLGDILVEGRAHILLEHSFKMEFAEADSLSNRAKAQRLCKFCKDNIAGILNGLVITSQTSGGGAVLCHILLGRLLYTYRSGSNEIQQMRVYLRLPQKWKRSCCDISINGNELFQLHGLKIHIINIIPEIQIMNAAVRVQKHRVTVRKCLWGNQSSRGQYGKSRTQLLKQRKTG